ncbi:MAG: EAL domain-containing protein [Anaeroplasma sp.]
MFDINFYDSLLHLNNDLVISMDLNKKIIEKVIDGDRNLGANISYEEFSEIFGKLLNLNSASKEKILKFLKNLVPSGEPFSINAKYEDENGEKIIIKCKGYVYTEQKVLITFSRKDKEPIHSFDPLTKIYTKTGIMSKFNEAIKSKRPFALMILDLDNFDYFNENYGHMFGDVALVETAAILKKFLKNDGFVSRIGGDKFMIITYIENNYQFIHTACTNIRNAISNLQSHNIKQATITATLGCSSYPKDGDTFNILFKKASVALARGKNKGRNCFIIYDEKKCGKADDYELKQEGSLEESTNNISTHFNIIAGIFEILYRNGSKIKNIEDSLSLLGNYFLLDRVLLITFNPDDDSLSRCFNWNNPRANIVNIVPQKDQKEKWNRSFDNTGMLKISQVESNKQLEVYPILHESGTTSVLAFSLKYLERNLGTITFDMCGTNKFWNQNDVASLMLISKIYSIFLNKEYENVLHIRQLSYDRLTNIYNYSKWRDTVYEYISDSSDPNTYSIISLSFDSYLHSIDLLGTAICDQALKAVADSIRYISREEIYCRVSEDCFLIFLPTLDKDYIINYLNELEKHTSTIFPYYSKFNIIAGIYLHTTMDDLTTAIDKANLSRKQPRITDEKYLFFTPIIYENQNKRLQLERHMYIAKDNNEFLLYLQPKVNTLTNEIVGAEALTRWNFNNEKILTPNVFIPLFEQNGFIDELDLIVFENVCKYQRHIIDSNIKPITISLNISRYQKNFDSYIDKINIIRNKYEIDPSLIEIEITEGMYIDNVDLISNVIKKLHANGYSISMDDFGAGYSNLSSLANLDFDTIKLDKNFCSKEGIKEKVILTFVMNLAKNLNLNVLCEGVETKELVEFLKSIGCVLVQGYYYDKPIPCEEFTKKYFKMNL